MTTPYERTKAVIATRDFLQMLAVAEEIAVPGLVQSVALSLLRHFPLAADVDVSAAALPGLWAPAVRLRSSSSSGESRPCDVPEDFPFEKSQAALPKPRPTICLVRSVGRKGDGQTTDERYQRWMTCEELAGQLVGIVNAGPAGRDACPEGESLEQLSDSLVQKAEVSRAESAWVLKRARVLLGR